MPSAILCFVAQATKIDTTSFEKLLWNRCSKLNRFFVQLGSILEAIWHQIWSQVGTKFDQKPTQKPIKKIITLRMPSGSIFLRFGVPNWVPGGGRRTHFWSFFWSWGRLGAKMAPRPLQEASGTDFGSILDRFWTNFGWFLVRFWMIFQWFW